MSKEQWSHLLILVLKGVQDSSGRLLLGRIAGFLSAGWWIRNAFLFIRAKWIRWRRCSFFLGLDFFKDYGFVIHCKGKIWIIRMQAARLNVTANKIVES